MIEVLALDDSPTRSPIYFPRGPQLEGSDEIFDMLARAFFRRADQPIRQHPPTSQSVPIAAAPCGRSQPCRAPATLSHSPVTRHDCPADVYDHHARPPR
jgi:hypothetical protein